MGLQPGLFSTGVVLRLEIRPCLPTQLVAEPPAGEVSGRLSFIGSPSPPQTPERASDNKQRALGSTQVEPPATKACRATRHATLLLPGHLPCHRPAARVPLSTRGRPRVRDSRSLCHDSTSLSATGLPAPYLNDSFAHCAGASLGRPE